MAQQPISKAKFYEIYPNGKVDMQKVEVQPEYVTAICILYDDRTADGAAYLVAESGVADRQAGMSLGECIAAAKDMAYQGAVARVVSGDTADMPTVPVQKPCPPKSEKVPDCDPVKEDALTEPDTEDTTHAAQEPVQQEDAPSQKGTVQKLDLHTASLFPDDSDDGDGEPESEQPSGDYAIQKARDTKITILGKYHECNNMSAGQILDEYPEVIQEFGPLYTGPKEDQKNALMALYPEALRRLSQKEKAA